MMERTLQQSTYEVFAARDGPHAAHLLCEPDGSRLALIDWMMPQLDRSAVCREVRSRHGGAYAYILLLTAKRSSEDIVQGLRAGPDEYLTKPCHSAELQARLFQRAQNYPCA
jgi:DNA-binding response OmpR family regulator